MKAQECKDIIAEVKNMPHHQRIIRLSTHDWDFINYLEHHFKKYPAWEEISPYWEKRFTEIHNNIIAPRPQA